MREPNYNRVGLIVTMIGLLTVLAGMGPTFGSADRSKAKASVASAGIGPSAQPVVAAAGEYYVVRQDVRRCASPLCGGFWVKRANQSRTQCANRRWMPECYVAEIDWNGQPEVEANKALLRGRIVARRFAGFGNLGAFRVTESWRSPSENSATGTFYRTRDRGLRCITHPCLSHSAAKLGSTLTRNVAGVDLAAAGASGEMISEAAAQMTNPQGVMVTGYFAPVTGPGGRAQTLKATKFYLLASGPANVSGTGSNRCFKTGCSREVCSDQSVVTACIFRPEFACYANAVCERQRNGECGFTPSPELRSCLARARR